MDTHTYRSIHYGNEFNRLTKKYQYLFSKNQSYLLNNNIVIFEEHKPEMYNGKNMNINKNVHILDLENHIHLRLYNDSFIKTFFYCSLYLLNNQDQYKLEFLKFSPDITVRFIASKCLIQDHTINLPFTIIHFHENNNSITLNDCWNNDITFSLELFKKFLAYLNHRFSISDIFPKLTQWSLF